MSHDVCSGVVGVTGSGQSVLEWLLAEAPDLALTAVGTGVAALWWPDSDSGAKATAFCRWLPSHTLCLTLGTVPCNAQYLTIRTVLYHAQYLRGTAVLYNVHYHCITK